MAQPEVIVFSTANVDDVPMMSDNNVFTGTNTFNVLNGTIGTITTSYTIGTIIGTTGTVSTSLTIGTIIGTAGTIPTILTVGTIDSDAYKINGTAGIPGTIAIQDLGTVTHTLTFENGILVNYGTA